LEALSEEFEDQVLSLAMSRAAAFQERGELSVADIMRASEDVFAGKGNRLRRYDRLTVLYLGFGASVAAGSIVLLLLLTVGSPSSVPQLLLAVAGVAGALLAGVGAAVSSSRARKEEWGTVPVERLMAESGELDVLLLSRWLELEVAARDAVAEHLGGSQADIRLAVVIETLAEAGMLSAHDVETFRRVLSIRNRVAHGHGTVTWESMEAAFKDLDELLKKFRRGRVDLERQIQ
jgi:hypothetical protein